MALTDDELAAVRAQLGDTKDPKDGALDDIHDRVGSVPGVILEVFNKRLAAILEGPASFSVSGYSERNEANIAALQKKIEYWEPLAAAAAPDAASSIRTIPLTRIGPRR